MAENQLSECQTPTPILIDAVVDILNGKLDFPAIRHLHNNYRYKINSKSPSEINYNDEKYRNAYLYMYFTALTRAVEHLLAICPKITAPLDQREVINICSIGGGPGTEIIGLKLFLISKNLKVSIKGTVLEYYNKWKCTYEELLEKLEFNDVDVKYKKFDFKQRVDQNSVETEAIKKADLLTLVKVVSGLSYFCDREENLTELLKQMKPGADVLFIDNSKGGYSETMQRAATAANLKLRFSSEFKPRSFIPREEKLKMAAMFEGKKLRPQEKLYVYVAMWTKPTTKKRLFEELNTNTEEPRTDTLPNKKLWKY